MRLMLLAVGIACTAVMSGCLPADGETVSNSANSDRAACEARGGTYEIAGRARSHVCFTPLPDAGKTCETGSDCAGFCLSDTKQCSAVTPQFGCISHLDDTGRAQVICID